MWHGTTRRRFLQVLGAIGVGGWGPSAPCSGEQSSDPARRPNLLTPDARRAVERGLTFLESRQNPDGSFGRGGYSRNAAVVALCGMGMLAEGSKPGRGRFGASLQRCLGFFLTNATDSGLIYVPEHSDRGPMYSHGFSTLFLSELYGTAVEPALREKLSRAVQLIISSQNDEGGWRYEPRPHEADISVTACQVMALRAAKNAGIHVPKETIDRAVSFVKRCQNPDGGFMYMLTQPGQSSFPRSAAALVALNSAGIYESDEVKRGLAYLKETARQNSNVETDYFFYGHYYAVQAMWHAGGDDWNAWYPAIRERLLARQTQDGSWLDSIGAEYGTAMACLILQMPSNYLPIFQR